MTDDPRPPTNPTQTVIASIWAELEDDPQAAGTVVRRVFPHLVHDVHLGQQRPSHERFAELQLRGSTLGHVPDVVASTRSLEVSIRLETVTQASLRLRETSPRHTDQFEDLVSDLLRLLEDQPGDGAAARLVERIIAWQDFFSRRRTVLGADAAAGLMAELTVLSTLLLPSLGPPAAVSHWTGPDPGLQDFQLSRGALEVKSFRGVGSGYLRISSERQLETTGGDTLFVAYVLLDQRPDGTGLSVQATIDQTHLLIAESPAATAQFDDKLLLAGWRGSSADERSERYTVRSVDILRVTDGFPRITPALLPDGVGSVAYTIDRAVLTPFLVTWDEASIELGIEP